jgi:ketosteroid isomerase-like protein
LRYSRLSSRIRGSLSWGRVGGRAQPVGQHRENAAAQGRDGEIVRYDDYMDPIALARLLGRTSELAAALAAM